VIPQLLLSGVALGGIYALVALGFSLLWQTSRTVNFAQGDLLTASAVFILVLAGALQHAWVAAVGGGIVLSGVLLGGVFYWAVIAPLLTRGFLALVMATLIVAELIRVLAVEFWSAEPQPFPAFLPGGILRVGGAVVAARDVWTLVVVGAVLLGLLVLLHRTSIGRAMRAVAQHRELARILGIANARVVLTAVVLNAVLACIAAILIAPRYYVTYDMGAQLGLKAFYAAIIGGFNSLTGAVLGGLAVGVVETVTSAMLPGGYRDAVVLAVVVAVILWRPQGLLGAREEVV
jgi:branched-chain amino acid transport system permease protein